MTSSHSSSGFGRGPKRRAGFTLTEVMIAATLSTIVLAGTLSSFLMMVRSGMRLTNYSVMESQTRRAFERLGIDARMASGYTSGWDPSGATITSCTFTIPSQDLTTLSRVTYGFANGVLFVVPGADPTATTGRVNLVQSLSAMTFSRYDSAGTLIPASTTSDSGIKHIQFSVSVSRSSTGVAAATQVIRSSSFTIRNITI